MAHLNAHRCTDATVLNNYGIGFYALLHQSCDRHSPLMDYEWIEKVGEGGFGQVHKVRNRHRAGGAGASGGGPSAHTAWGPPLPQRSSSSSTGRQSCALSTPHSAERRPWGRPGRVPRAGRTASSSCSPAGWMRGFSQSSGTLFNVLVFE